jgi:hypothetical protein
MARLVLRMSVTVALWAASQSALAQCELQRFVEDGGWEEALGRSVGINERFLMLGCPADDVDQDVKGSVYAFEKVNGAWEFQQKLLVHVQYGNFGRRLALDGERVLVGAPFGDGKVERSGAAYIFDYIDGQWRQSAKLFAEDGFYSQWFGEAVALRGERALIGAPNGNAAYLFDGVWRQVFKFYNPLDGLGADSVALGDGLVVIGDVDDFEKGNWSGAVSVFREQPDGSWGPEIKLTASDGKGFWGFGVALALRNETLFVGASSVPDAVYVFKQDSSTTAWRETAILKPSDPNNSARFGNALAVSGRTLIVGDSANSRNGVAYGAAYVFVQEDDGEWYEVGKLIASDGAPQDNFGDAVAVYGNEAVIGAPEKNGENYREGAAYLYAVSADADGDGVMDACECPGDLDGDRDVDLADLAALLSCLGRGENCADVDEDGRTDGADLAALLARWGVLCPR